MNRIILLADSNIYRNTSAERLTGRVNGTVVLINTTRLATLEIGLKQAEADSGKFVLVTALANILSDSGRKAGSEALEDVLTKVVADYVSLVSRFCSKKQAVLFLPPLYREEPDWYPEFLPLVIERLKSECSRYENLSICPEFRVSGVDLDKDKTHLLTTTGSCYIEHVVSCIKDVFASLPGPDIEVEMEIHQVEPQASGSGDINDLKARLGALEQRVYSRFNTDDVYSARKSEQLDSLLNKEMQDRVVVVGMKVENYPSSMQERKDFLIHKLTDLVTAVTGEANFDVFPRNESVDEFGNVPPFDLRFSSAKVGQLFKREAFKKQKEEPYATALEGVTFSPKVTLATRVRVEVLRAISRKITGDEGGYCPIYNVRPILQVGPVVEGKVERKKTLTYVDAVLKYKHLLTVSDLSFAYQRVGKGFANELKKEFLVLNDEDRTLPGANAKLSENLSVGIGLPRGTKRKQDSGRGGRGGFGSKGRGSKRAK